MSAKNTLLARFDLIALLLLWCGAVTLVNPLGDFPLNDDWAYAQNTRALAVENRLFFSDWPAMTLIAHTLWGALFCKIFGFSFTVLRFSTLLMGLFGLAGFYKILTWAGLPRRMMWGLVLLLAFNPLWFVLANSYMTDVPFLAMLFWSTLFFLKTLERPTLWPLLAATFFAAWACFIRQLGLVAPSVFLLLFLYFQPVSWRNVLFALFPLAACFGAVEGFARWLESTGQLPEAYTGAGHLLKSVFTNTKLLDIAAERTGTALLTVGLFLLPFVLGLNFRGLQRRWQIWPVLLLGACCIWAAWKEFPYGNVFYNLGLGPKLLKDTDWGENIAPELPENYFLIVKYAAAVGAGLLLLSLSLWKSGTTPERHRLLRRFSMLFCLGYLGFICTNWVLIDRHLLPFVPFLSLFIGTRVGHFTNFGVTLLGVYSFFSITATHDYLAWNRARWQAANRLLEQGVSPKKIDGGFEFNGWHLTGARSQKAREMKSWWFVRDDEWLVSFGLQYGYDKEMAVPYQRWLPPGSDTIFASRRRPYTVRDSTWCDMERLSADSTAFLPTAGSLQPGNGNTRSTERARQGQFSMKLDPSAQFGATMLLDTFQEYDRLVVSVRRYPANADAGIVVTAEGVENVYFFEPAHIVERDSAGWGLLEMAVTLPRAAVGSKGKFYLWNPSSAQTVWFDELKIYRLRAK